MAFEFTNDDIRKISDVLGVKEKGSGGTWSWQIKDSDNYKPMVLTLYGKAGLGGDSEGPLLSVQTRHGYYELHDISHYLFFEPDEIIFINAGEEKLSSLIIGRQCTCSLYSNINRSILNSDFSELDPAVLLSAMQLSITENVLD